MMEFIRDDIDLTAYMQESQDEHRVMPASDWISEVEDYFHKIDLTPKVRLPWLKTQKDFHFRPHELTLWAGINGHGKSQLVGQVIHSLAAQGQKVGIASLEMRPASTMARISRQAYGGEVPDREYIRRYGAWTDGKIWIYDHTGSIDPLRMLAVIRYTIDKFKVDHFVVDNLMKCGMGEDAYNEQKTFVDALCVIAKETGCHIHLVLHVKKGKSEFDLPTKFDVKGTGAITDLCDNLFIVWRNKEKESKIRNGEDYTPDDPDCILLLCKQRHGEVENAYRFYFDRQSLQYMEERNTLPSHFRVESGVSIDEVTF